MSKDGRTQFETSPAKSVLAHCGLYRAKQSRFGVLGRWPARSNALLMKSGFFILVFIGAPFLGFCEPDDGGGKPISLFKNFEGIPNLDNTATSADSSQGSKPSNVNLKDFRLTKEQEAGALEALGVSSSSQYANQMRTVFRGKNPTDNSAAGDPVEQPEGGTNNGTVWRRVVVEGGDPFPAVALPPVDQEAGSKTIEKKITEALLFSEKKFRSPDALPRCSHDDRIVSTFIDDSAEPEIQKAKSQVAFDMVFLQGNEAPTETAELFGTSAKVMMVGTDPSEAIGEYAVMRSYGVTCLPFRLRVLGTSTEKLQGAPALLNLDQHPNGKGEIDTRVRKYLE